MATNIMPSWQRRHLMEQRVRSVEDELLIALDLEMTIENMGVQVEASHRITEAAFRLAPLADIAVVDVNLSDSATSLEIGRQLRGRPRQFRRLHCLLTPEAVADGVRGALGVVQKPVMPRVVGAAPQICRRPPRRDIWRWYHRR